MKSAWLWLNVFLSIGLSSCAHAMGQRACSPLPPPPARPPMELCISNEVGIGQCVDSRQNPPNQAKPMTNYICTNADDYTAQEEWVKELLKR
jgi:hypothetical protein